MKKKLHIGLVSYYNLNKLDNGGKVRNHNIANELAKLGHKVHVIMPLDQIEVKSANYLYSAIEVNLKSKDHLSKIIGLTKTGLIYFKEKKVDVIISEHAWTLPIGIILSKKLKIPLILDEHNLEMSRALELGKYSRFIYTFLLEKLLIHFCSAVTFVSPIEKRDFFQSTNFSKFCIVTPNGSSIIPNKKDMQKYPIFNKNLKEKYKISDEKILALFIGDLSYPPNIAVVKDLNKIAQSISSFVQFIVVGKNKTLNKSKFQNIIFTGYVDSLKKFLYGCDITVLPLQKGGGTNLKVLEALTVGLPILCTKYALRGIKLKEHNFVITAENINEYPDILQKFYEKKTKGLINRNIDNSRHWRFSIDELNKLLNKYG